MLADMNCSGWPQQRRRDSSDLKMARVLFTCLPGYGHLFPMLPIAHALQRRGNRVRVASSASFGEVVRSSGVESVAVGVDWTESEPGVAFPGFTDLGPVGQAKLFASEVGRAAASDLLDLFAHDRPDVMVCDNWDFGGWTAGLRAAVPTVMVGVTGQIPAASYQMMVGQELRQLLADVAAPPDPELTSLTGRLFIDPTPPGFAAAPPEGNLRKVRPAVPDLGATPALLDWLAADTAPLIYVTLGTVFNRAERLMEMLLSAMSDLPVRVLAAVGPNIDVDSIEIRGNALVESFVPQATVLAHSAAVVCHGGRGTVYAALSTGVPLCLLPLSADQPAVAKRCEQIGVGVVCATGEFELGVERRPVLDPSQFNPHALQQAVLALLEDARYRQRARQMQAEISELPPTERAAIWIEELTHEPNE
jgi:UDP:flavonoid glycosyltransferase YjiC (YdhE family)